ncbi:Phist protein [Plasmodium gonderi]|uniref:Phist protein n=1 Tax=Plasmodium gonderi TaxID=77519 RepID=A0A1Y1JI09_PLAGO|nr:Phist protein [Plasmodium gonderi]GAW80083.1 Phist protein [Plasmodium gonderi]
MKDIKKKKDFLLSIIPSLGNIAKGKISFQKLAKEKEYKLKNKKIISCIFSKSFFSALVLSLLYLLLQNINTCTENTYSQTHLKNRHSRILFEDIKLHLKKLRGNNSIEVGNNGFPHKHNNNKFGSSENVDDKSKDLKNKAVTYNNLKNDAGKQAIYNKNEIIFSCIDTDNCEEVTEDELNDKLDNIKGPVNGKTMHIVWKYVHKHVRLSFIRMQKETMNYCHLLAKNYNIPKEYEMKKCKYVDDKITNALLKKDNFDLKNIKDFAKEDFCARWEFLRYINLKRKSWGELRESTKEKWANYINNSFKNYKHKK